MRTRSDHTPPHEPEQIAQEFDEDACDFCDRYKRKGLSPSSKKLLHLILQKGLQGKTATDLGCGTGGFSIELLKNGAENIVGFDLSSQMIESANHLALSNNFDKRTKFQVGNAATVEIPHSDIIIMDKVLCCYSDWKPLLNNAITSDPSSIGFIVPRDEGVAKLPFRLGVRIANYFQKRKGRILFYLHPLNLVDRTLYDAGFSQRKKQRSRLWLVFLYSRPEPVS
jgi:SAM-dependent methyltransferase